MAGEWKRVSFGRMATLVRDTVIPSDVSGLPYIGLEHIAEGSLKLIGVGVSEDATSMKSRFKEGDILFGKLRPYFRKVIRAPFDGICSTDIWVVRPCEDVDAGYLFYTMASDLFVEPVVRASEGTKMPRAKWEYATSLELPLPPLPEQRAIAHILGTLDDKIELNRRMNETLEQMARALFKSWFVDFDPVRAKAAVRRQHPNWTDEQVSQAACPNLNPEIAALFPDSFQDSELGAIPKGWICPSFENMVVAKQGKYLPNDEMKDTQTEDFIFPVWGGNGIRGYSRAKMYDYPVVVLTCRGSNCGLIYKTDSPSWISNIAFACEPKIGSTNFIYVYFSQCSFLDCISGSAQPQITYAILQNKLMPHPIYSKICETYSTIVDPIFQKISICDHLSRTLAAIRDALLPKLISGQIRVKDAGRFLLVNTSKSMGVKS